jgi:hypothetical protein
MKNLIKMVSFFMAGAVGFFSPMTISHGDAGCCAECALKKEEEVEVVYEDEDNIGGND